MRFPHALASRAALALAAAALALPVATPTAGAGAPPEIESASGTQIALLAGPSGPETFVAPLVAAPSDDVGIASATITVNYDADFMANDPARAAFQRAVDLWEQLIVSSVPIVIDADFDALGQGILGSAGPNTIHRSNGGCLDVDDTWYPAALANTMCGADLSAGSEAGATFNSAFSIGGGWYFGLDGKPAGNQYDFVTVVMHELGHSLGFLGSMSVLSNGTGTWGGFQGCGTCPMIYDTFAEDGMGTPLLSYTRGTVELKTALTGGEGGGVFFAGPNTDAANGGVPAKLYAPATWQQGSSYSHLDENTFNGSPDALMTPILGAGEAIHSPGLVVLGAFDDMGWPLPVAPDAPTGLVATAGSNAAAIAFVPPANDGGSAVTVYTATATPDGAVGTSATSPVYVAGLTNGTPYTFTITATNFFGTSPPSVASTPAVTPGLHGFHPLEPERILDTRHGVVGADPRNTPLTPQEQATIRVTGYAGAPPDDANAVVMNVTATAPSAAGWLTVWDTGSAPTASNLNFAAGQTVANLVTVKLDPNGDGFGHGTVKLGNTVGNPSAGFTHVIFDVVGYYSDDGTGDQLNGEAPTRILDTRPSEPLLPQEERSIQITGGLVPPEATAVVMNVTAVTPSAAGWLTVFPSDQAIPTASNLNFAAGQVVANLVEVKVGPDGQVKVGNTVGCACAGSTHLVLDVVGWYGPAPPATGGGINAVTPARILDTRNGVIGANLRNVPLAPQEEATIQVAGFGTVPPSGVSAVVLNVTAVTPTAGGWLTLWPLGTAPTASNLNFAAGQVRANLVIVALAPDGTIKLGNSVGNGASGFTHVIFDVVGWFATP